MFTRYCSFVWGYGNPDNITKSWGFGEGTAETPELAWAAAFDAAVLDVPDVPFDPTRDPVYGDIHFYVEEISSYWYYMCAKRSAHVAFGNAPRGKDLFRVVGRSHAFPPSGTITGRRGIREVKYEDEEFRPHIEKDVPPEARYYSIEKDRNTGEIYVEFFRDDKLSSPGLQRIVVGQETPDPASPSPVSPSMERLASLAKETALAAEEAAKFNRDPWSRFKTAWNSVFFW